MTRVPKSLASPEGIANLRPARPTLVRLFSQTPTASSLPVGYEPFLLLSGSSETTEMQATIKLPHKALGFGLAIEPTYRTRADEVSRTLELRLFYRADRQIVLQAVHNI